MKIGNHKISSIYYPVQCLYEEKLSATTDKHTLYKNITNKSQQVIIDDEFPDDDDLGDCDKSSSIKIIYEHGEIVLYYTPYKNRGNIIATNAEPILCRNHQFLGEFHKVSQNGSRYLGYPKTINMLKILKKFIKQNQVRIGREYEDLDIIGITEDGDLTLGIIYGTKFSISRYGMAKHRKLLEMSKLKF